jgi:hypothetical protein
MAEQSKSQGKPWLLVAALVAPLACAGAGWLWARLAAPDAQALALRPPIVVLDLAAAARAADPAQLDAVLARQRAAAERLAAAGFLVLDAQAVLAAPPGFLVVPPERRAP